MEPIRNKNVTLVDLLERVLDKGLVLNADLVISVSGIPLIGVNLRAALAGMTTMLKYGMMEDLDSRIREHYRVKEACGKPQLMEGERIRLRMFGAHLYEKGIIRMWRVGYLYLTDRRLLLLRKEPAESLLEISLEHVRDVKIVEAERFGRSRREIHLQLANESVLIHAENIDVLMESLQDIANRCM